MYFCSMVAIIMGSKSDLPVMQEAIDVLHSFSIETEVKVVSAHRTPLAMVEYAESATKRGIKVIIGRCRRGCASTRYGGFFDYLARYWRTH